MYIYSAIRTKSMPSAPELQSAQKKADEENDEQRDVRPLMSILMRFRRVDPRLRGHMLTRTTAVSSFDWNITPRSPNPSPQEIEQAARVRQRCAPVIREVIRHRLQASLYDAMCIECVIDRTDPLGAVQRPVRRFRPVELEKKSDYELLVLADGDKKAIVETLPVGMGLPTETRSNYIVSIGDDDERGGLLRSIAQHERLLWDMTNEWSNFNKKLKGIIQGVIREGAEAEEKGEAVSALRNAASNNYFLSSDLIDFKFNQITQAGAGTSFKEMLEFLRADVAITMLGQANTSELPSGGGSRAALQVLNLVRSDIMFDDMLRTEECINSQVLLNDARLNYDPTITEAPYEFTFDMPDGLDPEVRARIITDLYNAGIPLLKNEVYAETGLTAPPDGNTADIIQKQSGLL